MGQSIIVTIGPVFILSDVFLAVAVVIAKAQFFSGRPTLACCEGLNDNMKAQH